MESETEVKAVQNPFLLEAIKGHFEKGTDATANALVQQLKSATFLTAMIENNLEIEEGVVKKGSKFGIALIKDGEGRMLLPLFSDRVHLNESAPGKDGLVMSADWAFSMAIEQYEGVVINHTGMALPIYKDFLSKLIETKNA
jgi:hypothetical protein